MLTHFKDGKLSLLAQHKTIVKYPGIRLSYYFFEKV